MSAASRQPWIHSAGIDGAFILGPGLLATLVSLAIIATGHGAAGLSLWTWGVLIVGIDVAHVYSTIYRTYLDPVDRHRLSGWLVWIPLAGWTAGVLLYSMSAALFWTALAYLAVFHFIRQQYGFLMIYSRGERALPRFCSVLDKAAVYAATLGPLAYWHTHLPRRFVWFIDGDFVGLPGWIWQAVRPVYALVLIAYVAKEAWLAATRRQVNLPRNAIVLCAELSWYVGIVAGTGDLILLAFLEEGLCYVLVWREHLRMFPGFGLLPHIDTDAVLAIVVPLLAVPQLTHYVIDGVIWRLKSHPEWRRTLFWGPGSAAARMRA